MIATDALCSGVYCCFGKGRLPIIWVVIVTTIVITIVITIVASMAVYLPHVNPNMMLTVSETSTSFERLT